MESFLEILGEALGLILAWDSDLMEIIGLSLRVTLTAVAISCAIGLPLGAAVGAFRFPGRTAAIVILNALMGLPPVVVGLIAYLMLSAAGPLGPLGLLYTPAAMIIAQTILVTPLVAALSRQVVEDYYREYAEQFDSLGVGPLDRVAALLWDARYSLLTVALAGFGRAVAEVGAVIVVGGNINHVHPRDDHDDRAGDLQGQSRTRACARRRASRHRGGRERGRDDAQGVGREDGLCLTQRPIRPRRRPCWRGKGRAARCSGRAACASTQAASG